MCQLMDADSDTSGSVCSQLLITSMATQVLTKNERLWKNAILLKLDLSFKSQKIIYQHYKVDFLFFFIFLSC